MLNFQADVSICEAPKCLAWCRDTICLGFKRDYMLVKLKENEPLRDLFPTGEMLFLHLQKNILLKCALTIQES